MPDIIINPFDATGYDLATMTNAINLIDSNYGRVRSMNLFRVEPVTTKAVVLEEINGTLTLLQTRPSGAPATRARRDKAKIRSFAIPHIPFDDRILPSDIQGKRAPGSTAAEMLAAVMSRLLERMRASHAITEEHLMAGAVKGKILDADGSQLFNLYTEFGKTQKTVNFELTTSSTDVLGKCRAVTRHIEDNLMGDIMSGVHCLCGENFFDALIAHENVEKFFLNHAEALNLAGSAKDPRKGFNFGGITFEEYRGKATDPSTGSARAFIGADDAHFFPIGTQATFDLYHAPAEFLETVNTPGRPLYAKQVLAQSGRHIDVLTESNPLPICRRPAVLVKGIIN